jgi:hypothetical protein
MARKLGGDGKLRRRELEAAQRKKNIQQSADSLINRQSEITSKPLSCR